MAVMVVIAVPVTGSYFTFAKKHQQNMRTMDGVRGGLRRQGQRGKA
jgi:hypothetical protein